MSKLACYCGHVISNAVYPSRTEGVLLRQVVSEQLSRAFPAVVDEYLSACREGRRATWLSGHFDDRYAGLSLSDGEVINDLLSLARSDIDLSIAECEICGRLWVQRAPGDNKYASFVAEDGVAVGILDPDREK